MIGALLAAGSPAGLLMLRSALGKQALSATWIASEIAGNAITYAYLTASTLIVAVIVGWILGKKEDCLQASASIDALTGIANRGALDVRIIEEMARATRYRLPLALLLIDVDALKQINDRHGHERGDAALKLVAESICDSCRAIDLPARYGGDEFTVLLPASPAAAALVLANRICRSVQQRSDEKVSVSIGVAEFDSWDAADEVQPERRLLKLADQALYDAKSQGRNRAVLAGSERLSPLDARSNPPKALHG